MCVPLSLYSSVRVCVCVCVPLSLYSSVRTCVCVCTSLLVQLSEGVCVCVCTSLLVQLGEDVSQAGRVVDPLYDATLLVQRDHGVRTDAKLPAPRLCVFTEALCTHAH